MQLIRKLQEDQECMKKVEPSSRSKAIEDIISIRSFVEALVLNHYVLVRKILLGSDPFLLFTMSNITDIKSILTQKGLDIFCHNFHIPRDVHPRLPNPNQTIHEMHTEKIGVYTKFFERVVLLLTVALAHADNELEVSVDRLFHEGGSTDQGGSAAGGGQETKTELVTGVKGDHGPSSGATTGGKSSSVLKELLASSMLNVKVGVTVVATMPLVTSLVSATPEHENGVPTDSIIELNLRTIDVPKRLVISSNSSHHSSTNASGAEGDSLIRSAVVPPMMTEAVVTSHAINVPPVLKTGTKVTSSVHASMFHDSDSTETMKADTTGPSYSAKQDLSIGSRELNSETMHQIREMDYHHLFTEFNVRTARQACLNAELLLKETKAAEAARLHAQDLELKDLNVVVSSLKYQKDGLVDQVLGYEWLKEQIEEFQDAQMNIFNDKVAKLDADLLEMAFHLKEKFYPHLLITISSRRWLLTHDLKLAVVKCLNSQEYLSALGSVISRAIEKGMQDGLSAGIDHGKAGPLADAPGMSNLQPDFEQLTLPIHRPKDLVVLGEVSTSDSVPTVVVTNNELSTTFSSASFVPPITIEDYEIVGTDGPKDAQGNGQGNVASFPTVEFEKEELDTTPEHDPPN
nr:hypothetical protein [Tanacetum cinerariifolium]